MLYQYQLHNCPLVAASISTTARGEKETKDAESEGVKDTNTDGTREETEQREEGQAGTKQLRT